MGETERLPSWEHLASGLGPLLWRFSENKRAGLTSLRGMVGEGDPQLSLR